MEDANVLEMRSRVRRHMLTSFFGAIGALVLAVLIGGVLHAVGGDAPWVERASPLAAVGMILLIPVVGWISTFRNLRCPSCNGLVACR